MHDLNQNHVSHTEEFLKLDNIRGYTYKQLDRVGFNEETLQVDLLAAKASPCDRDKLRIAQFYVDNKDALIQSKHYAIEMPVGGKANLRRMTDTYEYVLDLIELSEDGIESFWLDAFGAVNDENELTAEERSL